MAMLNLFCQVKLPAYWLESQELLQYGTLLVHFVPGRLEVAGHPLLLGVQLVCRQAGQLAHSLQHRQAFTYEPQNSALPPHLYLGVEHLGQAGGEAGQVLVPPLYLGLQAAPELVTEELLLVREIDHALLHPGELPRQQLLELCTVGVHLGARP